MRAVRGQKGGRRRYSRTLNKAVNVSGAVREGAKMGDRLKDGVEEGGFLLWKRRQICVGGEVSGGKDR